MLPSLGRRVKREEELGGNFALVWHSRDRAALVNADARLGEPVASRLRVMARRLIGGGSIYMPRLSENRDSLVCLRVCDKSVCHEVPKQERY